MSGFQGQPGTPGDSPIPSSAQEQARLLASSIKAQADQRIQQAVNNITNMLLVEMFLAGYASALRDNDLMPADPDPL